MQVRTTRNVAMMSITNNKRSMDNSNRDSGINRNERRLLEEKQNRVQFAAIGSSEAYIDLNTEGVKKQRSIAPVNIVIPLSSTYQKNDRITYDQLVLEAQQSESDSTSGVMGEVTEQPQQKKRHRKRGPGSKWCHRFDPDFRLVRMQLS
jgi:hypothetical protein